jgi:hypothetical protein
MWWAEPELNRRLSVSEHRLQQLTQAPHRLIGVRSVADTHVSCRRNLNLIQLGNCKRLTRFLEEPLDHAADERHGFVPLQGNAPAENV